ncbi:MAG: SsrA-binding protein SmpB [Acidobacteriota bacterium]
MAKQLVAKNRKAFHDYEIVETYEAGIVLQGTEVKSIREGRVNLKDSYAQVKEGELWLQNCHISPYPQGNIYNHEPLRPRKLLLHKRQINKLTGDTTRKGLTLVPLSFYFLDGRVKVEIAVARGKKAYDKRETERRKDVEREVQMEIKRRRR